jgi:phage terminase small subunit
MIEKPRKIATNDVTNAKWDELVAGRDFSDSDIPVLTLLCQWYAVLDSCVDDINVGDRIQVAYQNDMGDVKALPQLGTMKMASAEIRALNKQLGINDTAVPAEKDDEKGTMLYVIQANRQARATNRGASRAG